MGLRDGTKSGHTYVLPKLPPEYKVLYEKLPPKYFQTELALEQHLSYNPESFDTEQVKPPPNPPPQYPKGALNTLENTGLFEESLVNHIFEGEVKEKWKSKGSGRRKLVTEATGFHSECIENHAGQIIEGTRSKPDAHGVYTGMVSVNGVAKKKPGLSTFYPRDWTPQQIVNAVNEAYRNRELVKGDLYRGKAGSIYIRMFINENEKIASAFPEQEL